MKCPICKTEIPESAALCSHCGFEIVHSFINLLEYRHWLLNEVLPFREAFQNEGVSAYNEWHSAIDKSQNNKGHIRRVQFPKYTNHVKTGSILWLVDNSENVSLSDLQTIVKFIHTMNGYLEKRTSIDIGPGWIQYIWETRVLTLGENVKWETACPLPIEFYPKATIETAGRRNIAKALSVLDDEINEISIIVLLICGTEEYTYSNELLKFILNHEYTPRIAVHLGEGECNPIMTDFTNRSDILNISCASNLLFDESIATMKQIVEGAIHYLEFIHGDGSLQEWANSPLKSKSDNIGNPIELDVTEELDNWNIW